MFATFLNREDHHLFDLSVFINYSPEELLFYYYNSTITITLETYLQMKEWLGNCYGKPDNLIKWLDFINQDLDSAMDMENFQESEYLQSIGPYYYGPTNTQFFFSRFEEAEQPPLTSADFEILNNFHKLPVMDRALNKYSHSRRNAKKAIRNKDELIRDISMCAASLRKIENLNQYILYINKFLERRQAICDATEISPPEPVPIPEKPSRSEEPPVKMKLLHSIGLTQRWQNKKLDHNAEYNRLMKIYFINSREYEKACERYKQASQEWNELKEPFLKKCQFEMEEASSTLKEILNLQSVYQEVIHKSFIHADYQEINILNKFQRYLETGRANDLQGCMNIYEDERHWMDVKESQERIENTIYFLYPDNETLKNASNEVRQLIASTVE